MIYMFAVPGLQLTHSHVLVIFQKHYLKVFQGRFNISMHFRYMMYTVKMVKTALYSVQLKKRHQDVVNGNHVNMMPVITIPMCTLHVK